MPAINLNDAYYAGVDKEDIVYIEKPFGGNVFKIFRNYIIGYHVPGRKGILFCFIGSQK